MRRSFVLIAVSLVFCCAPVRGADVSPDEQQGRDFFENRIRPLLVQHCYECHGSETQESEFRLDNFHGLMLGGVAGMAIVPGEPEESLLFAAVSYVNDDLQMPPESKLSDREIADLRHWIEIGAPHPDSDGNPPPTRRPEIDWEEARRHWAFRTPESPRTPGVADQAWPRTPLDYFILSQLEANGLAPAPPADKTTLLRRLTFDLTGLPPTPAELQTFLEDDHPGAYARVVERLLNSPRYGERWGRFWLDVARYADSNGLDENIAHGNAWRYRDYVVASFNSDKPYDEFLREQLAGDLMPTDDPHQRLERLVATGFLVLGPKVLAEGDELKMEMDIIDEQLNTIGQTVLGLTLGCARCHDHKFDPVTQRDYYAMAGILKSTRSMESLKRIARWHENELATPDDLAERDRVQSQIDAAKKQLEMTIAAAKEALAATLPDGSKLAAEPESHFPEKTQQALQSQRGEIAQLEASLPTIPTAMGVTEGEPTNVQLFLRGNHLSPGREVPRNIPTVLQFDGDLSIESQRSGRLALANWLTRPEHPLTARVIANRVWRWYFGAGLVSSVDNFGKLGSPPANPPLLDWLAVELMQSGWSLKRLHRQIVMSSTYQMSSTYNERAAMVDPENRMHWRAPLKRLEAEALRDAILFASGTLEETMGGSLLHVENREFIFNHTSKDETSYDRYRRSIYLPVIRNHLYDMFSLFDYSDASVPNGDRPTSTIAPQALFLLNSELLADAVEQLVQQLLHEDAATPELTRELYLRLYGRPPSESELKLVDRSLADLRQQVAAEGADHPREAAWIALTQVLLASNEFIYLR